MESCLAAAKCYNDVGVHDMKGSIADAKASWA